MVSGVIECGYCKKKVSRNCYGKHLLSKGHQEQFLKENRGIIEECFIHPHKKTPMTTIDRPAIFTINKESCSICFTCKKYYSDKDYGASYGRLEATDHFTKSPDCKANYIASLKKFTVVKKLPVGNKTVEALEKELRYWKNEASKLKMEIECNEEENDRLAKRSEILEKIIGNAMTDDELDIRFQYIKSKFKLPLYE